MFGNFQSPELFIQNCNNFDLLKILTYTLSTKILDIKITFSVEIHPDSRKGYYLLLSPSFYVEYQLHFIGLSICCKIPKK